MSDKEVKCWRRFSKAGNPYLTCQETYGGGTDRVRVYQDGRERQSHYAITRKQRARQRVRERVEEAQAPARRSPARPPPPPSLFPPTEDKQKEEEKGLAEYHRDWEKRVRDRVKNRSLAPPRQSASRDPLGDEIRRLERKLNVGGANSPEEWAKHHAKLKKILQL